MFLTPKCVFFPGYHTFFYLSSLFQVSRLCNYTQPKKLLIQFLGTQKPYLLGTFTQILVIL